MILFDYLECVEKVYKDWVYMGEWVGIVIVVDLSGQIDLDVFVDYINKVIEVKIKLCV